MPGPRNESALQLLAVQLDSINANYPDKTQFQRFCYRLEREFFNRSLRDKAAFVAAVARRAVEKLLDRLPKPRPETAAVASPGNRLRVAAQCNGGLGDLIIYSGFLDRFYRECGGPSIDVVVHRLRLSEAEFVFHNSPSVAAVVADVDLAPSTTPYDIVIKLGDLLSYEHLREESIRRLAPDLLERLAAACALQRPYRKFIDRQPSLDGMFTTRAAESGLQRLDVLGWMGGVNFTQRHPLLIAPDPAAYARLVALPKLHNQRYVTIHNGWDNVAHRHSQSVTKAWPLESYVQCVELFKQRFPDLPVVQLGAKTSQPIPTVDLCLLNDTSLHEAAWILKHSLLHIDGDSGLVHLARALNTTSLVLFGPTNQAFFGYARNRKLYSTNCGNCWWVTNDWMRTCARGLAEPECMKSIRPEAVVDEIEDHLHALRSLNLRMEPAQGRIESVAEGLSVALELCATPSPADERSVAVIDAAKTLSNPPVPAGWKAHTFRFGEADPAAQVANISRADGEATPTRQFGSVYNIPAETGSFEAVVLAAGSDRVKFPGYALREALRILKPEGVLVATLPDNAEQELEQALVELGVAGQEMPAKDRALIVRKLAGGPLFPNRTGLRILHAPHAAIQPAAGPHADVNAARVPCPQGP